MTRKPPNAGAAVESTSKVAKHADDGACAHGKRCCSAQISVTGPNVVQTFQVPGASILEMHRILVQHMYLQLGCDNSHHGNVWLIWCDSVANPSRCRGSISYWLHSWQPWCCQQQKGDTLDHQVSSEAPMLTVVADHDCFNWIWGSGCRVHSGLSC